MAASARDCLDSGPNTLQPITGPISETRKATRYVWPAILRPRPAPLPFIDTVMSTIRDHYASHLAPIYLWMAGGFDNAVAAGKSDLEALGVKMGADMGAMDLGAGFGMHAIPLARAGCAVTAVDESAILLGELRTRAAGLPIRVIEGDILKFHHHLTTPPDLVLCMGDTLTHIQSEREVEELFAEVS